MSQETPIENYKLVKETGGPDISFNTGNEREFKVVYNYGQIYSVARDARGGDRVSSRLTPDQAEAYATLLMYAAKVARERS